MTLSKATEPVRGGSGGGGTGDAIDAVGGVTLSDFIAGQTVARSEVAAAEAPEARSEATPLTTFEFRRNFSSRAIISSEFVDVEGSVTSAGQENRTC